MSEGSTTPDVAALVDALDARARQAGSEGATNLVRGMIGTLSETLTLIDERLDRVEAALRSDAATTALSDVIQSNLATFNARLARLEEAFVQALDDSGDGTAAVVDQVRQVVTEAVAGIPRPEPAAHPPPLDLDPVVGRLLAIEGRLAALESRPPPAPPPAPEIPETDVRGPVIDALAPLLARLSQLEEQTRRLAERPPPEPVPSPIDEALAGQIEDALSQLRRDDPTSRLVAMVEERVNAGLRAMADRAQGIADQVETLRDQREAVNRRFDELAGAITAVRVAVDDAVARDAEHASMLASQQARLQELGAARPVTPERLAAELQDKLGGEIDRLSEHVDVLLAGHEQQLVELVSTRTDRTMEALRREAELLTQRVAALAVGVEATRLLAEQLVDASEQSLGRKAGEVGRRLAQDLGLRNRRAQPRGQGDRELGPGR